MAEIKVYCFGGCMHGKVLYVEEGLEWYTAIKPPKLDTCGCGNTPTSVSLTWEEEKYYKVLVRTHAGFFIVLLHEDEDPCIIWDTIEDKLRRYYG